MVRPTMIDATSALLIVGAFKRQLVAGVDHVAVMVTQHGRSLHFLASGPNTNPRMLVALPSRPYCPAPPVLSMTAHIVSA